MPNKTEPHVTRYSKCVPSSRLGAVAFGVSHGGVGVSHLAVAGQPLLVSFWRGARRRETAGRLGPWFFPRAGVWCGAARAGGDKVPDETAAHQGKSRAWSRPARVRASYPRPRNGGV